MEGAVELAEEIFHMPVRLGVPHGVKGLATWCATRFIPPGLVAVRPAEAVRRHFPVGPEQPCHRSDDDAKAPLLERLAWVQGNF
jgi:cell division protein FtsA